MTDIALNEKHRVTSDGIQWMLQRRQKADWSSIAYCHTKAGLLAIVTERLCKRGTNDRGHRDTPVMSNGKRVMDLQPGAMLALRALPEFHP